MKTDDIAGSVSRGLAGFDVQNIKVINRTTDVVRTLFNIGMVTLAGVVAYSLLKALFGKEAGGSHEDYSPPRQPIHEPPSPPQPPPPIPPHLESFENMRNVPLGFIDYIEARDMRAFGICLSEKLTFEHPFDSGRMHEVDLRRIADISYPGDFGTQGGRFKGILQGHFLVNENGDVRDVSRIGVDDGHTITTVDGSIFANSRVTKNLDYITVVGPISVTFRTEKTEASKDYGWRLRETDLRTIKGLLPDELKGLVTRLQEALKYAQRKFHVEVPAPVLGEIFGQENGDASRPNPEKSSFERFIDEQREKMAQEKADEERAQAEREARLRREEQEKRRQAEELTRLEEEHERQRQEAIQQQEQTRHAEEQLRREQELAYLAEKGRLLEVQRTAILGIVFKIALIAMGTLLILATLIVGAYLLIIFH